VCHNQRYCTWAGAFRSCGHGPTWQVIGIRSATYPRLRAIEALSLSAPPFLFVFAATYFATERGISGSFSEGLTRTDALYLAVTVFASVGFGDITPVTQAARVMVTVQMIGDLILVGLVARVILGAVRTGLRQHESDPHESGPRPRRSICVDQLEVDARAASAAGLRGIWLNRAGDTVPPGVEAIDPLADLPSVLEDHD
jgi:hypothetical protein